ncbi:MAG: AAC(3) family N-acetyltransferase [Desulfobacterales bacterium]
MNNSSRKTEVSRQHIVRDLKAMGIDKGDHLALGISFKSIGYIVDGPEALIDALLETVGPEGTIMMNTFTEFFYPAEIKYGWIDYIFDSETTKVNTGIVPETLRKRKNAIRSKHPTHSVAAIGKMAEYLTECHDETSSAFLPFSRLSEINGKYLAIGIGERLVGFRHQAQYLAGLLDVVSWRRCVKFKAKDGQIKTFILRDRGGCPKRLSELVPHIRKAGLVQDGKIGMAVSLLVPAKEALGRMAELLKKNPESYLCGSVSCLWCRELERKLNLYDKIENPRYFQKNIVIRKLVGAMNWLREKDYKMVTRIKLFIKKRS